MTETETRRRWLSPHIVLLFLIFAATAGIAIWQGSNRPTPTIFTDEIEMAQLGRSIIETGHASLRGLPRPVAPIGAYLSAPFWLISNVSTAYMWLKVLGAVTMAMVVFPAYALARLVVRPGWALFAAAGAGISPALAYAPVLVKEPTAYPIATLALFLIARWLTVRTRWSLVLAIVGCVLGYLAKGQLQTLFGVFGLCVLAVIWQSKRVSSFRATWSRADWVGFVTLVVGVVIVGGAYASSKSTAWYVTTTFFQGRMIDYGLWAVGALTIGVGLIPLIAGLASLVRPKDEPRRASVEALAIVTVASLFCFGLYTGIKAAYLSTIYGTLILERNLIYLVPLLFAGTALFFERRGGRWWAVALAACLTLYLIHTTPYALEQYPNYEANGLAIIAFANRIFRWPASTIERAFVVMTILIAIFCILLPRLRTRQIAGILAAAVAAFTLAWTGTAEVYAAHGENLFSEQLYATLPKPPNWLDNETHDQSTTLLGQSIKDPNPVNLLEFWNRSLKNVWALDGTAPGPGATATPDIKKADGTLSDPGTVYVLATPGVDLVGHRVNVVGGNSLIRLGPDRLRIRTAQTGIYPDGWMGRQADFTLYDVPAGATGHVTVTLSRAGWCGKDVRGEVLVQVGPVGIKESNHQPTIARVTGEATGVIHSCQVKTFVLPTPPVSWRVEVTIDPTFVPRELDPSLGDVRELGATVGFAYRLTRTVKR